MKLYLIGIASLLLSSCTTVSYDLHPRSHYDYPNSNVKPLGEAVGRTSQISLFVPPQPNGEIERQAVESALRTRQGADLLINYVSETKILMLPFINIMTYSVHGTAAAMPVGLQKVK